MAVLDRKVIRDAGRLWAQGLAIALVMACGAMTLILAVGAYRSLEVTREAFYERYRFATVFATVTRAPRHLVSRISAIEGVASVELRIVKPVILDVEGMAEPASGIVVSIPDARQASVNRLYVRKGRLPEPGKAGEVAIAETFALAHGFEPGDRFSAILNGRKRSLEITGIVLSPEYVYAIGPGDMVPDQRRYGILFMSAKALSGIFDMEGAFNDIGLVTLRNADLTAVMEALDKLLKPYGGTGAFDREDQISNAFLDAELTQLRAMSRIMPPIFLLVSAFLVNMILSRLVALEREQIGLLKALGYSSAAIGWHYAKHVILISAIGLAAGSAAGFYLGRALTRLYADFFSFPFLIFHQSADLYIIAGAVTLVAGLAGAAGSIWTIASLPPAVAMRPPAPASYHGILSGRLQRFLFLSQLTRMAFRHLLRRPFRSFFTMLGTSLSVGLLVAALFSFDSIDTMIDIIFFRSDRSDAMLTFSGDRGPGAIGAALRLPGVIDAEPFRVTPVNLRKGHRELRMSIAGLPPQPDLARILDANLMPMEPPQDGIVLSDRVAMKLGLRPGDFVEAELVRQNNRVAMLPVVGIAQSYVGLTAYMRLDAMNRLLRDGDLLSGVRIVVDANRLGSGLDLKDSLYGAVKQTPAIASIALQDLSRERFRETIRQNIVIMMTVYVGLAVIITFGVIYNSARIQLSERARELASLRVFGFTRAEVSRVLLIELGTIVLAAQPLGWLIGLGLAWSIVTGFDTDLYRIPFIVNSSTLAWASAVVLTAAILSMLIVRRRVDSLDLIRVLKTRE